MSPAHWIYLAGIAAILVTVVLKRNVVALAIGATFVTALAYTGSVTVGVTSVFNAALVAARELFPIFLIIAVVTALLGAMRALGSDRLMVAPFQPLMRGRLVAYVVLGAVTFVLSMAFWPTPMLPLIGAILVPAAVRAGLTPFACAIAVAITGQGMALSSDYVMGVAPSLSAEGAKVAASAVADRALVIALVAGVVALGVAYLRDVRGQRAEPTAAPAAGAAEAAEAKEPVKAAAPHGDAGALGLPTTDAGPAPTGVRARAVAVGVPLVFALLLVFMLLGRFTTLVPSLDDGVGAPLVGGAAALLVVAVSVIAHRRDWTEDCAGHFVDGLSFSFRTMGMVVPIAGFIYIGLTDFSGQILGMPEDATGPGFLIDAVGRVQHAIPAQPFVAVFAMLAIGMLVGLDGNGWPSLPFTGSLAGALGPAAGVDPATLAAIAQNGASWTGGGTLVIWSSLIAVAGVTGVSVIDLARRLFVPVVTGLVVAAAFAALFL